MLKYCLSASLRVLQAGRWKDNLISIPWDSANRPTVHQTRWWRWAKLECHHIENHPILIIRVGKGDSFRWSAHLLLHLHQYPSHQRLCSLGVAAITGMSSHSSSPTTCSNLDWAPGDQSILWTKEVSLNLQIASAEESQHSFRKISLDINYLYC